MIIKKTVPKAFRGTMSEITIITEDCFQDNEKRFVKNENIEISTLLTRLISMICSGKGNIREYIMEMFHLTP